MRGQIPRDIIEKLEDDYNDICDMLRLGRCCESTDVENYINDLQKYPVKQTLNEKIDNKVKNFYNNVFHISHNINYRPTEAILETLVKGKNLLSEQLEYIEEEEVNCIKWLIVCSVNTELYGAVCVFYNPQTGSNILMQGISRCFIPLLIDSIQPGSLTNLPRLNSLIQLAVETIGYNIGANQIVVAPIGKQGDILEKHYGYKRVPSIIYPCQSILGQEIITRNPESFKLYAKDLQR